MLDTYNLLARHLREGLPQLAWIDLDKGQLTDPRPHHSLVSPALLINMGTVSWEELGQNTQIGSATITLKLAFVLASETHADDPNLTDSVAQLELAERLHRRAITSLVLTQRTATLTQVVGSYYVIEQAYLAQLTAGQLPGYLTVPVTLATHLTKPNTSL